MLNSCGQSSEAKPLGVLFKGRFHHFSIKCKTKQKKTTYSPTYLLKHLMLYTFGFFEPQISTLFTSIPATVENDPCLWPAVSIFSCVKAQLTNIYSGFDFSLWKKVAVAEDYLMKLLFSDRREWL